MDDAVVGLIGKMAIAASLAALGAVAALTWRAGDPAAIWLTPDQRGLLAMADKRFADAAGRFEHPGWRGLALYRVGDYAEAAGSFGRIPTAIGFYNRGDALMKNREYGKAIEAFELAVAEAPAWREAQENLALAELSRANHGATADPRPHLEAALGHVTAALEVYDPEHMPFHHEQATRLRDDLLARLGDGGAGQGPGAV